MTLMEDNLSERHPQWKMTSLEEDFKRRTDLFLTKHSSAKAELGTAPHSLSPVFLAYLDNSDYILKNKDWLRQYYVNL